jgi:flagellar motor protein MotB
VSAKRLTLPTCGVVALLLFGCGATGIKNYVVADMERLRASPNVHDAAVFAPQQVALAEAERAAAVKASHDGDEVSASLHAGQAIASYTDALALARLARATEEKDRASADLARDEARAQKLAAERTDAEHEATELENKLRIAQETLSPAPSGRADPEREAARLIAARALAEQARLLCGAARLVSPTLEGLDALDKEVDALDAQLAKRTGGATPIDAAARTRAACLGLLTRARRTSDAPPQAEPDTLLSELSASGQFEPSRDERGVVVTLREAFKGTSLSPAATSALAELGRIASAHPGFGVQVVLHDAAAPSAGEASADSQRAQAAAAAIVAAGAPATHVKAETAGARSPIVDPQDARHRARNARLEVVFVGPGG